MNEPQKEFESPALQLIATERERHQKHPNEGGEGWTKQHDTEHEGEQLAVAAACYALPPSLRDLEWSEEGQPPALVPKLWPWEDKWWKPKGVTNEARIRDLVKAGALIAAEIDRRLADEG